VISKSEPKVGPAGRLPRGNSVGCYEPHVPAIETNLAAIVSRVHDLTSGHEVIVVLLDYSSVWVGGQ
jgi:hypothetical protein